MEKNIQKSILFVGGRATGKTMAMKQFLEINNTKFSLDEAVSSKQIKSVLLKALKANSFAVVSTQLDVSALPQELLLNFDVIHCSYGSPK